MLVALNLKAVIKERIYSCGNPKQESLFSQFNINSSNFNNMIFNHNPKMAQSGSNTISAFERMHPQQHLKREERSKATVAFAWSWIHSSCLNFFLLRLQKSKLRNEHKYHSGWQQSVQRAAIKDKFFAHGPSGYSAPPQPVHMPSDMQVPTNPLQLLQC